LKNKVKVCNDLFDCRFLGRERILHERYYYTLEKDADYRLGVINPIFNTLLIMVT